MGVKIAQDYEYVGGNQWKWWVWLEGEEAELDQVASVEYHLHPTFPQPVREVKDRDSKFRLDASGWGVFRLKARVRLRDGSEIGLGHLLELEYPPDTDGTAAAFEAPTRSGESTTRRSVFLSAGSADSAMASELKMQLLDKGVDVWSADDIEPGMPWQVEIEHALENADAVVALTSDIPSRWVEREVVAATQQGTKVIPVVVGDNPVVPEELKDVQQIRVYGSEAVDAAANSIIDAMEA
jgi:hypothetical protein